MNNNIIETLTRIETKLDAVIKALHEYDDEYGKSSFEAFMDDEEAANKRMDIIGQNGNEGSHYVTNEEADEDATTFNDYEMRVVDRDKDNDTQDKRTGGDKKRTAKDRRKYYKPKQTK
jgi:hypothetical protein